MRRASRIAAVPFAFALLLAGGCATPPTVTTFDDPLPALVEPPVKAQVIDPNRSIDALKDAIRRLKAGELAQADADLAEIVRVRPDLAEAHLNLGWSRLQRRRPAEAIEHLKEGLRLKPAAIGAHNLLGLAFRESGRFAEAEQAYLDGLKAGPNHDRMHLNLGILYDLYLGETRKALTHYRRYQALQKTPDPKVAGWIVVIERALGPAAADDAPASTPAATGGRQ